MSDRHQTIGLLSDLQYQLRQAEEGVESLRNTLLDDGPLPDDWLSQQVDRLGTRLGYVSALYKELSGSHEET